MTTKSADESPKPAQEHAAAQPVDTFPDGAQYASQRPHEQGGNHRRTSKGQGVAVPRGALIAVAAVLVVGMSFFAGVQYQKGHATSTLNGTQAGAFSPNGTSGTSGMGGRMGNRAGGFGTVTAVSSSSITITQREFGPNSSSSSGTSKTYTINDSTTVTANGSTGSVSDIQTGDTVFIRTASSTSTVATEIRVGDIGGPGGAQPGTTQSDSSSDTDANTI